MCGVIKVPRKGYVSLIPGMRIRFASMDGRLMSLPLSPFKFVRWETFVRRFKNEDERRKRLGVLTIESYTERDSDGNEHEFAASAPVLIARADHGGQSNVGIVTVSAVGSAVEAVHGRRPGLCPLSQVPSNADLTGVEDEEDTQG